MMNNIIRDSDLTNSARRIKTFECSN